MSAVRPTAVAGSFYPADAAALRALTGTLLAGRHATASPPKLLIVPHAGYAYSGATAAAAYTLLASARERITRVVLLGPAHRVPLRGLAAPQVEGFDTPLGHVPVDRAALACLDDLPQVEYSDLPHANEHSLEVQLPFLQVVLGDFSVVPLVIGNAAPGDVAEVLERLWGTDDTLIVISSDLSHYLPYARAQAADRATVERILALDPSIDTHEACGAIGIDAALIAARRHRLVPRLLDLCNSGDTAGDRQHVVGYAAIAFEAAPR